MLNWQPQKPQAPFHSVTGHKARAERTSKHVGLLSRCLPNTAGKVGVRGCVYKRLPACKVKRAGEGIKGIHRMFMNDSKVKKHSVRAVHTVQV